MMFFRLKPTYGRLSRAGVVLFSSIMRPGPFARSVRDIATAFDVLQGEDARDNVCTKRPRVKTLNEIQNIDGLKMAIADVSPKKPHRKR